MVFWGSGTRTSPHARVAPQPNGELGRLSSFELAERKQASEQANFASVAEKCSSVVGGVLSEPTSVMGGSRFRHRLINESIVILFSVRCLAQAEVLCFVGIATAAFAPLIVAKSLVFWQCIAFASSAPGV